VAINWELRRQRLAVHHGAQAAGRYQVVDAETNNVVAESSTRPGAQRKADRANVEAGSDRHVVRFLPA
jgi:hypothetical protein